VAELTALPDPCPLPSTLKKRGLNEKERLLYAPMADVGGLLFDKDAVYVEIPDWKVPSPGGVVGLPVVLRAGFSAAEVQRLGGAPAAAAGPLRAGMLVPGSCNGPSCKWWSPSRCACRLPGLQDLWMLEEPSAFWLPEDDVSGSPHSGCAVLLRLVQVQFTPGAAGISGDGGGEGEAMVRQLQGVQMGVDEKLERSKIRIFEVCTC
jgi:hypothetical protein